MNDGIVSMSNERDPIDEIIASAIKMIVDSTPHKVTYSTDEIVIKRSDGLMGWKTITTDKLIEVKLNIRIPQ